MTLHYDRLNNIYGDIAINNHFHTIFPASNNGIKDGNMFPHIYKDWVDEKTSNNSKICIMEKDIFSINKILIAPLGLTTSSLSLSGVRDSCSNTRIRWGYLEA